MTELIPFSPGTEVCMRKNIFKKGIITNNAVKRDGNRIKQEVKWDGVGKEYINIALLKEDVNSSGPTVTDLIDQGHYGRNYDLLSAITRYRLSGVLDNLIYSLNVTNTEFLPYQFQPLLTFLNSFGNSLLIADEVGLGKTIEAGLIWTELRMRQHAQRLIVVCPSSLCQKWKMELADKFLSQAEIVNAEELSVLIDEITSGLCRSKIVIASMQTMRPPKGWEDEKEEGKRSAAALARKLRDIEIPSPLFDMLIVDEAHHFRNEETRGHDFIQVLRPHCGNAIFLSATPIQTKSDNLYSLLNLLDEETFNDPMVLDNLIEMNYPLVELISKLQTGETDKEEVKKLSERIRANMAYNGYSEETINLSLEKPGTSLSVSSPSERLELIKRLNRLNPLNQYMNRSLKRFVQTTRVKRNLETVSIKMADVEKAYYCYVTQELKKQAYAAFNFSSNRRNKGVLGFVLTLAQQQMASCMRASYSHWKSEDAFNMKDVEDLENPEEEATDSAKQTHPLKQLLNQIANDFENGEGLLAVDSKYDKLLDVIRNYQEGDIRKKIIVFSFYKKTISYLERRLRVDGINAISISGDVASKDRAEIFECFEHGAPSVLLSTEVAAEGLDFQFVSCLINYDLPWNPAKIEQRIGRIDRIGQKSDKILIFNFVYKDSIEERVFSRLYDRVRLFTHVLGYSEEVLGKVIDELSKRIFSLDLTPEEEEEEIKRAEQAIQNLENQKDETEGMSIVYDMMQNSVKNAKTLERFVLDEDLLAFVSDFCDRDPEKSRLIQVKNCNQEICYKLVLSIGARANLEDYLERHAGETDSTDLFLKPNILLKFKNKADSQNNRVSSLRSRDTEVVTQTHPLIGFISEWWDKQGKGDNTKKTAAIVYSPSDEEKHLLRKIPQGIYAYRLEFWTDHEFEATKFRKGLLAYRVRNIETNTIVDEEIGELLVNKAARSGNSMQNISSEMNAKCLVAHDENESCLSEDFGEYADSLRSKRMEENQFRLNQYTKQLQRLESKYEEQLQTFELGKLTASERKDFGLKGRMVRAQNIYNREHQRLEVSIRRIQNVLEKEPKINQELISVGIIDFRS